MVKSNLINLPAQGLNITKNFKISEPLHFIGIGGSGMAPLAELALNFGFGIQGSDVGSNPAIDRLIASGVSVRISHDADALRTAGTVIYSSAIKPDNVERLAASSLHLPLLHRSDLLALFMTSFKAIAIAGSHGKSTTSAMITFMLEQLGLDPLAVIGGTMLANGSAARTGRGSYFVAEADESDGTFLKYRPFIGVLTNIGPDHLEFYQDQSRLELACKDYLQNIDPEGCAVIGWDSEASRRVGLEYHGNRITFGFVLGAEVRGMNYLCRAGELSFTAVVERDLIPCRLKSLGRHNVQNALCCLAVARALGLNVSAAAAALAEFPGVERRLACIYRDQSLGIYDDYAHNPGKISASIAALREAWPDHALHVVFQPHRYSRLETMYKDMLQAVQGADFVHIVPVYAAGETTLQDFSPARLAGDLRSRLGITVLPCANLDEAVSSVERSLVRPATVLTVGAGDVGLVAKRLLSHLSPPAP